jgi:hypothetical protein
MASLFGRRDGARTDEATVGHNVRVTAKAYKPKATAAAVRASLPSRGEEIVCLGSLYTDGTWSHATESYCAH